PLYPACRPPTPLPPHARHEGHREDDERCERPSRHGGPGVELGRRGNVDELADRVVFGGDEAGLGCPPRAGALAHTGCPHPVSSAPRRPSLSPSSSDEPETTGELRSTTSFSW